MQNKKSQTSSLRTGAVIFALLVSLVGCSSQNPSSELPTEMEATESPTDQPMIVETLPPNVTIVPELVTTSSLERIRQTRTLRVGILYSYPPLAYLSETGAVEGYEAALIAEIASRWEVDIQFVQVTRQTRLPMLLSGEIDVLAGAVSHTRDLEQFVDFSTTTFQSGYAVLTGIDSGFTTISGIGSRTVGTIGTDAKLEYTASQEANGITPSTQHFALEEDALAAYEEGGISAIVGRREVIMRLSSRISDSVILPDLITPEPYAFAVMAGDTPTRDLLDVTMMAMDVDGTYGQIFAENLFSFSPDEKSVLPGEISLNFENMPTDIPHTESVLERLRRGEPLRVAGMDLDDDPELFDGQPIVDGFHRAVVNELARRWGVPVIELPNSAGDLGMDLMDAGEADLVIGVPPTMGGVGRYGYSLGLYERGLRLLHLDDVTVAGVGDLEYKPSIAMQPVDVSEDLIRDNNSAPDIQSIESLEEAFESLLARGVYAVIGDEFSAALMVQADPSIEVDETRYRATVYVIAAPNQDVEFITLINVTLQDMYTDGTLTRLYDDYLAPYLLPDDSEDTESLEVEIWPGNAGYLNLGVYVP